MTTTERLTKIIDELYAPDELFIGTTFDDLDLDSLDKVLFCMEVEKEFDIAIQDSEWEQVLTVGDIVELVDKLKGEDNERNV